MPPNHLFISKSYSAVNEQDSVHRFPGPIAANSKPGKAEHNVKVEQHQTPGLGFHILLASFSLETEPQSKEEEERVEYDDIDSSHK